MIPGDAGLIHTTYHNLSFNLTYLTYVPIFKHIDRSTGPAGPLLLLLLFLCSFTRSRFCLLRYLFYTLVNS